MLKALDIHVLMLGYQAGQRTGAAINELKGALTASRHHGWVHRSGELRDLVAAKRAWQSKAEFASGGARLGKWVWSLTLAFGKAMSEVID